MTVIDTLLSYLLDTIAPKDYKAEVIYVVDSSSFVGLDNYQIEKDFVKYLARVLNHNPSHTQSSVIIFDSFFESPIRMGSYRELGSFSEAVNNLRYLGGSSSRLDFALAFAVRGFSTNRPDVPKIIIVITNKDPPNKGTIDSLAGFIRQEGKAMYVIAVGNEADFPNLQRLVVRPGDMYTPKAFADVMNYVPSIASDILAREFKTYFNNLSPCVKVFVRVRARCLLFTSSILAEKKEPQNFQHCKNGRQEIAACKAKWAIPVL